MRIQLTAAATALAVSALAGCGGSDDSPTAEDPASTPISESSDGPTEDATEEPTVGTYPELEAPDYTFVLQQFCFCPITGPVKVTVADGEVTSAVIIEGQRGGVKKGSDAPEYLHQTINDVIAQANNTEAASVEVDWPADQDWPNSVAVDPIENAVDDEFSYAISDVEIAS